jgi:hypothetical protein
MKQLLLHDLGGRCADFAHRPPGFWLICCRLSLAFALVCAATAADSTRAAAQDQALRTALAFHASSTALSTPCMPRAIRSSIRSRR